MFPNVISEDMRVTFAKDLGLTVVYSKIIFILVKSIGPAAAGPAGPVPAPQYCTCLLCKQRDPQPVAIQRAECEAWYGDGSCACAIGWLPRGSTLSPVYRACYGKSRSAFLLDLLPRPDARLLSWPLHFPRAGRLAAGRPRRPTAPGRLERHCPMPHSLGASLIGGRTASGSATAAACGLQRPASGTLSSPASSLLSGTYHV